MAVTSKYSSSTTAPREASTAVIQAVKIAPRVPRVPQRTANDGRERATTVTRSAEEIRQRKMFGLFTGL